VQLTNYYRQIEDQNVKLFAVSVDPPEASEALRQRLQCDFTFLSDPDGKVLDLLNIRHRGGREQDGGDIAFPAQVLVDKDGIVRWTYQSDYYRVRARPEQVFAAIAQLPR
jgi:peroxiredoxin